jgi:hypothetical protein
VDIGAYEAVTLSPIVVGANVTVDTANSSPLPAADIILYGANIYAIEFSVPAGYIPNVTITGSSGITTDLGGDKYRVEVRITDNTSIALSASNTLTTVAVTTSEHIHITTASAVGSGGIYSLASASAFSFSFTLDAGFDTAAIVVNPKLAYTITKTGATYTLSIPSVIGTTISVNITETVIQLPIPAATVGAGIENYTAANTVAYGQTYTATFTLAAGYHRPYLAVNGLLVPASLSESAGTYTITIANVTAAPAVVVWAFPTNIIPVSEDACARQSGTVSIYNLLVYYVSANLIDIFLKFDLAAYNYISSATLKLPIAGYSATGKDAVWSISIADNSWSEGSLTYATKPADLGLVLATTTAGANGAITDGTNHWMEDAPTLIEVEIPLDADVLQTYKEAGNSDVTIHITIPVAITGGGEIDIASKEAATGT